MHSEHSNRASQYGRIIAIDEQFRERQCTLNDDKVTGTQMAMGAGFLSQDEVIVMQQLKSGALEEIRPEELVDISHPGIERFFIMESDATYRLFLDELKFEWPKVKVGPSILRKLACKSDDFEIIQQLEDAPDRVLEEHDLIDLSGPKTERFITRPASKNVTVYYGETEFKLPRGAYTTESLSTIFKVEVGYLLDLLVDGKLVELKPGQETVVKDGMRFVSHPPRGQSS